jgi:hypothetical protein
MSSLVLYTDLFRLFDLSSALPSPPRSFAPSFPVPVISIRPPTFLISLSPPPLSQSIFSYFHLLFPISSHSSLCQFTFSSGSAFSDCRLDSPDRYMLYSLGTSKYICKAPHRYHQTKNKAAGVRILATSVSCNTRVYRYILYGFGISIIFQFMESSLIWLEIIVSPMPHILSAILSKSPTCTSPHFKASFMCH